LDVNPIYIASTAPQSVGRSVLEYAKNPAGYSSLKATRTS